MPSRRLVSGSKPCKARAGRKSSRSQPARVSSARVLSTSGEEIGASATARAIARWLTSTSRLWRSRARVRCALNLWQKRVARLTLRVSRVSIQRLTSANPSGRSTLLAALLAGASARIAIPSPRGFQASRTAAQETRPSSDDRSGTAQVAGRSSSPPRALRRGISSTRGHGALSRNQNAWGNSALPIAKHSRTVEQHAHSSDESTNGFGLENGLGLTRAPMIVLTPSPISRNARLYRARAQTPMKADQNPAWIPYQRWSSSHPSIKAVIAIRNMIPGHQNLVAKRMPNPISQIPPITARRPCESKYMRVAPEQQGIASIPDQSLRVSRGASQSWRNYYARSSRRMPGTGSSGPNRQDHSRSEPGGELNGPGWVGIEGKEDHPDEDHPDVVQVPEVSFVANWKKSFRATGLAM